MLKGSSCDKHQLQPAGKGEENKTTFHHLNKLLPEQQVKVHHNTVQHTCTCVHVHAYVPCTVTDYIHVLYKISFTDCFFKTTFLT